MIVRESPNRTRINNDRNWPPRSPRDALLSSPTRQRRLQRTQAQDDNTLRSPSRPSQPAVASRQQLSQSDDEGEEDDDDDDEETIQLRLQAIEARLKLKKLQKAKEKAQATEQGSSRREAARLSPKRRELDYESTKNEVQVPLSPRKINFQASSNPPQSPRRVQLGIDKGLRANDVSLKKPRPEPERRRVDPRYLPANAVRAKSFNERLAEARVKETERFEKQERARNNRSYGFGLTRRPNTDEAKYDMKDVGMGRQPFNTPSTVPQQHGRNVAQPSDALAGESSSLDTEKYSNFVLSRQLLDEGTLDEAFEGKELISIPKLLHDVTAPHYDPPDTDGDFVVFGIIASKSSPYNKAQTHLTSTTADEDDEEHSLASKFMVLKLTDLKWEINLFLFDSAFARFWKLTVGTVIAILNPGIMPPKVRDTGQFSLKLGSSEDTILELGVAKDIGWCKSIKKDGQECMQWIDGRKTEFCDFHVNMRISKAKAGRMEINGMVGVGIFGKSKTSASKRGGGQGEGGGSRWGGRAGTWNGRDNGHHRNYNTAFSTEHQQYSDAYVLPKSLTSKWNTAQILDAEDYVHGGLSKAEQSRKRLAAQEKERELAQKLGMHGGGLGGEYMRLHHKRGGPGPSASTIDGAMDDSSIEQPSKGALADMNRESGPPTARDAASLGLLRGRGGATTVDLGPAEGRRGHGTTRITSEPMGWSGAFKRGLLSPTRARSPEKKRVKLKVPSTDASEGDENHQQEQRAKDEIGPDKKPSSGTRSGRSASLAVKSALKIRHNESSHNDNNNDHDDDDDDDELDIIV